MPYTGIVFVEYFCDRRGRFAFLCGWNVPKKSAEGVICEQNAEFTLRDGLEGHIFHGSGWNAISGVVILLPIVRSGPVSCLM